VKTVFHEKIKIIKKNHFKYSIRNAQNIKKHIIKHGIIGI